MNGSFYPNYSFFIPNFTRPTRVSQLNVVKWYGKGTDEIEGRDDKLQLEKEALIPGRKN